MIELPTTLPALLTPVLSAVGFALLIFSKKYLNRDNPQTFELSKFLTYLLIGAGFGVGSVILQIQVSQETITALFFMYGGAVVATEAFIKSVFRWLNLPEVTL